MFWIMTVLLIVIAASFVIIPLQRRQSESAAIGIADRNAANLRIFKERLTELERDLEEGLLDQSQFNSLKAELEHNILADVEEVEATTKTADHGAVDWKKPVRLIPVIALVAVLPFSYLFYSWWGFRNDLAVAEIFERSRGVEDPAAVRDLIFELGAVVERDPENGWALYFIARHLVTLGQFPEASMFFERAAMFIDNPMDKAVVLGQYAQAQYIASEQQMTDEVKEIIAQAQRLNPGEPAVLQLLGADAFVNQDYQAALTYWQRLLNMNPGGEDAEFLQSIIAQAQQMLGTSTGSDQGDAMVQPRVEIALSVAPEVVLPGQTRVFISAQNPQAGGPPLAAKVVAANELPAVITLSDADAVGPFNISSASQIVVVATASLNGSADVQTGDYQVRSEVLELDHSEEPLRLQLQIRDAVR